MVAVHIGWVKDEEAQEALADLVRPLARQAAREAHRQAQDPGASHADGCKRMVQLNANGEVQRELLQIDEAQAEVVGRIFTWFAAGLSSIQIATRLNDDGVPAPWWGVARFDDPTRFR